MGLWTRRWRRFGAGVVVGAMISLAAGLAHAQLEGSRLVRLEALTARNTPITLTAALFEPAAPAQSAVVLLHSSGGLSQAVQGHYGRAFSAAGHLVLAVDSFRPRGIVSTVSDQSQAGSIDMALDALHARRYIAREFPGVRKVAVMGFSKGGLAAMFTADRTFHGSMEPRFDAHIGVYPSCAFVARHPKPVGPLLILLGEKDSYSGVEPCRQWASAFERAGGRAEVKVYPDAHHSFDGDTSRTTPVYIPRGESFADCLVHVEDDGRWTYQGRHYPDQLATYPALSSTCVKRGAWVGAQVRAKAAATEDALRFLGEHLRP